MDRLETKTGATKTFHHAFVIDASGSMAGMRKLVVDTFNENIQNIRGISKDNPDTEHLLYVITFSSLVTVVRENVPVSAVKELTDEDYVPNGTTALYDSIGDAVRVIMKHASDSDGVVVTVITDGAENSSREYSASTIKELVEKQQNEHGWTFDYVGADVKFKETSASLGIKNASKWDATEEGMESFGGKVALMSRAYVANAKKRGKMAASQVDYSAKAELDASFDPEAYARSVSLDGDE